MIQNKEAIAKECEAIAEKGDKAIITAKDSGGSYVYKVGTVEEFTRSTPIISFSNRG